MKCAALGAMLILFTTLCASCAVAPATAVTSPRPDIGAADTALAAAIDKAALAIAQELPAGSAVYIAEVEGDDVDAAALYKSISTAFSVSGGKFSLISRLTSALLVDEAEYVASFHVDSAAAARIAYKTGADYIVYGAVRRPASGRQSAVSIFAASSGGVTIMEETFVTTAYSALASPLVTTSAMAPSALSLLDGTKAFALEIAPLMENADAITLYHEGSPLRFSLKAARDCYVKLAWVNVKGELSVIFPVDGKDDNFLHAGETRVFSPGRVVLEKPYGEEAVIALVYEKPFVIGEAAAPIKLSRRALLYALAAVDTRTGEALAPAAAVYMKYKLVP
jgi:hypothetical protein